MEKLTALSLEKYSRILASDAPAPGGGSASALAGAQAAALTGMVAALTIGKAKYADDQDLVEAAIPQAEVLRQQFTEAIDADCEAYQGISRAFGLPKSTPEEKAARSAAIQEALIPCTESPLHMMELAQETAELTHALVGHSNASAASDLGVAALMTKAAVQGAWLNVLINLGSMKDEEAAFAYRIRGERILEETAALADHIYEEVLLLL